MLTLWRCAEKVIEHFRLCCFGCRPCQRCTRF